MINAAVAALEDGREIRVLDIAAVAGVSHSLIYRHFPDGGRQELIAEAYAQMFRASVADDVNAVVDLSASIEDLEAQLTVLYGRVLAEGRSRRRWGRLEALAESRRNEYAARRMDETREELVDGVTQALMSLPMWQFGEVQTRAYAIIALGVPLGFTALVEPHADAATRHEVAKVWAQISVAWLERQNWGAPRDE